VLNIVITMRVTIRIGKKNYTQRREGNKCPEVKEAIILSIRGVIVKDMQTYSFTLIYRWCSILIKLVLNVE